MIELKFQLASNKFLTDARVDFIKISLILWIKLIFSISYKFLLRHLRLIYELLKNIIDFTHLVFVFMKWTKICLKTLFSYIAFLDLSHSKFISKANPVLKYKLKTYIIDFNLKTSVDMPLWVCNILLLSYIPYSRFFYSTRSPILIKLYYEDIIIN